MRRAAAFATCAAGALGLLSCTHTSQTPPPSVAPVIWPVFAVPPSSPWDPANAAAALVQLPTPSDYARDPTSGAPIAVDPSGSSAAVAATVEWNAYLRSLDGFPPESVVTVRLTGPIDVHSLSAGNAEVDGAVALIDLTTEQPLTADDFDLVPAGDKQGFSIVPHLLAVDAPGTGSGAFRLGHHYLALVFGDSASGGGLRAAKAGTGLVASPDMTYLRMATPAPIDDPARAARLEGARAALSPLLDLALPIAGADRARGDLALAFDFTVAHGPFAAFDWPARTPYPSDALRDPASGLLSLPVDPSAPDGALLADLDRLDGFGTSGRLIVPLTVADDARATPPVGATAGSSVRLVHLATKPVPPMFAVAPVLLHGGLDWDGDLALSLAAPLLPDGSDYLGLVTNAVHDARGRALRPSSMMRLLLFASSLVDEHGASALPSVIGDADANRMEALRGAIDHALSQEPVTDGPPPFLRADLAAAFAFQTGSLLASTTALVELPARRGTTTAVTIASASDGSSLGPDVAQVIHGTLTTHLALLAGGIPGARFDGSAGGGSDVTVPFVFIAPALARPSGVVLVLHGFEGWRGDLRGLGEAASHEGYALLGIDAHLHGQRSACVADTDCSIGGVCHLGQCSTGLALRCRLDGDCLGGAIGACQLPAGTCASGLDPDGPRCMRYLDGGALRTACNPAASGAAFPGLSHVIGTRDALRQQLVDLAQLRRVLEADGTGSLREGLAALPQPIDISGVPLALVGEGLGAIGAALYLAVEPRTLPTVLSGATFDLASALGSSPTFATDVAAFDAALRLPTSTAASLREHDLLRAILDGASPRTFSRYIAAPAAAQPGRVPPPLLVLSAGSPRFIAAAESDALAAALGLPLVSEHAAVHAVRSDLPMGPAIDVSTYYPSASDALLLGASAATAAMRSARAQAMRFIASGGREVTRPAP